VQNSISFDVTARRQQLFGKDDTVDDLWIDAVPSPDLSDLSLRCKYPSYLKRKDETLPVTGIMSIPEGTEVAVDAVATKDLVSADCQIAGAAARSVHVNVANGGRRFQFDLGAVRSDAAVAFTLHDTDGVSNRQPLRLQIRAVPDQPPEVDVRFAGIGKAITRQAILPLRGQVKDSHLVKAWFEFAAAKAKGTQQQTFEVPRDGQLTKAAGVALDVEDLILKPGGRFHVWVKAEDACPLPGTSHVGASPRIDFEVVTEQQLRGILEGTEHLLRGRHDGVMDSLRRDRDSLRRIETDAVEAPMAATAPAPSAGDQTAESRLQSRSAIRVESTLERATWSTHEVLEMAEQFERIVEELENNRVEHLDDLRSRLMDRIAAPLRRTASEEFPKLRQRLQSLRGSLADADRRRSAAAEAEKQLDVILHQLEQVRAEMIESEDLNNLVAQLRSVIEKQAEVGRTTRERQQQLKNELGQDLE
jgi:hypothetical protein